MSGRFLLQQPGTIFSPFLVALKKKWLSLWNCTKSRNKLTYERIEKLVSFWACFQFSEVCEDDKNKSLEVIVTKKMVLRSNCILWKFVFSDSGMSCVCVCSLLSLSSFSENIICQTVWIRLTPENSLPLFC